ncbi:MAG: WYL domain-containing protein [Chromatiaceae bacterium]
MSATYQSRIQRLRRLETLLPPATATPADCPDGGRLLQILGDDYGTSDIPARRRALQRDLMDLLKEGRIAAVNPGGKPLRYRRLGDDVTEDPLIWQYTLQQVKDLIAEAVPARRLDRLWERLLHEVEGPLLDARRLRCVPDTLRLRPVELYPDLLQAVIQALAQGLALQIHYQDAEGERGEAVIHPQALVQRGPIPYLLALKNDEVAPVRFYALHRMIRAQVQPGTLARAAAGFDLDQAIAQGRIDFGQGKLIDLELRVRGYLATLLEACPLSDDQRHEDEPEDSGFLLRIKARIPSTGQLLRWLLGAGDNLEVMAPAELRRVVAAQSAKTAALYAEG